MAGLFVWWLLVEWSVEVLEEILVNCDSLTSVVCHVEPADELSTGKCSTSCQYFVLPCLVFLLIGHRVVPLFVVAVVVSDEGTLTLSSDCARHIQGKRKDFLRFIPKH